MSITTTRPTTPTTNMRVELNVPRQDVPDIARFKRDVGHPDCDLYLSDNIKILPSLKDGCADLIYIDPPFNTQKIQTNKRIMASADVAGERRGFGGKTYKTALLSEMSYIDKFDDFIAFIQPRLEEAHRLLDAKGSLFLHIDYREVHYCKVVLDKIFGRENFMNEIIWVYDFGGRSRSKWSAKHDNILWYAKDKERYTFNYDDMDRIPYMAPGLVGEEKESNGKRPTDVWWNTIVPTNGEERTGYPSQKPLTILERIVRAHSNPGDTVLDFFAGTGTTGVAALRHGCKCILIDENKKAAKIIKDRIKKDLKRSSPKGEYDKLVETSRKNKHRIKHADKIKSWERSPFGWVLDLQSAEKSAFAIELIKDWLKKKGVSVGHLSRVDRQQIGMYSSLKIGKHSFAIKFSTLWNGGNDYRFQQVKRSEDFDYLLCLGIHPNGADLWIADYKVVNEKWDKLEGQHTGRTAKETKWISISPGKTGHWLLKGGDIEKGYKILCKKINHT